MGIEVDFCIGRKVLLATYDERITALEKDVAEMKEDIIYKLDETNHNDSTRGKRRAVLTDN